MHASVYIQSKNLVTKMVRELLRISCMCKGEGPSRRGVQVVRLGHCSWGGALHRGRNSKLVSPVEDQAWEWHSIGKSMGNEGRCLRAQKQALDVIWPGGPRVC